MTRTIKRGRVLPYELFALRGRPEDFDAAERELGPIPRRRPMPVGDEVVYVYRLPSEDNNLWPTTGQFRKFNIRVIPPGSCIDVGDM